MENKKYIAGHTGKIPYLSRAEALAAVRRMKNRSKELKVYACSHEFDMHFHTTSMARSKFKQLKKEKPFLFR